MGRRALDIVGHTFGRLLVLRRVYPNKYKHQANFLCRCSCGNLHEVVGSVLKRGGAMSCGCLGRDKLLTHGLTDHPLYNTWLAMIDRCHDSSSPTYPRYGGRGIVVVNEWRGLEGLQRFIADMGQRPPFHTLDRIDNDGPYRKSNCRWATRKQQALNTRRVQILSHDGRAGSLTDWARWTGLGLSTIRARLAAGQTVQSVLEPVNRRHLRDPMINYINRQTARPPVCET